MHFTNPAVRKQYMDEAGSHMLYLVKCLAMGLITGTLVGLVCTAFSYCLLWANAFRAAHPRILFLMPAAGLTIVFLYRVTHDFQDTGTNMVIRSIRRGTAISKIMAPLIFVSTVLSHLTGASVGREGAALQLGGSLTQFLSDIPCLHFSANDRRINVMCGMCAGFSALFGTPMAAAVFSLEVASVGIMQYSALVPCVLASFTARMVSAGLGVSAEAFPLAAVPAFHFSGMLTVLVMGVLLGLVSIVFAHTIHTCHSLLDRIANPYLRIAGTAVGVIALTCALGTREYLGSGIGIVEEIFESGQAARWYSFLLKMLFTALCIGSGFKGGEIVPSLAVGAAFGSSLAGVLHFPVPLAAACGMLGVFCGMTNCPITSLLIGFELFGFEAMPYFLVVVAVSYMMSGYQSLYHSQKIIYSKIRTDFDRYAGPDGISHPV